MTWWHARPSQPKQRKTLNIPYFHPTIKNSKGEVAQLQQHDAFFSMLTPRETVDLAAYLQLGREWKRTERTALVDSILDSLGLRKVEHRQIGATDGAGGLSGGERRRLSVGTYVILDG